MKKLLFFAVLLFISFTGIAKTPSSNPFMIGIMTHTPTDEGVRLIKKGGIAWVRDEMYWSDIEKTKGKLALTKENERYINQLFKAGIQPLLVLDYSNEFYDHGTYPSSSQAIQAFVNYCTFIARCFKGKIHAYEIWNEWNGGCGMRKEDGYGEPEGYVALLKQVYPALKKIDPSLVILAGGMADSGSNWSNPWLEKACKLGMLDYCDGLSIHPYCFSEGHEQGIPEKRFIERCKSIFKILKSYKLNMPVYITEIGWPTHDHKNGSSTIESANYLARTYLLSATIPQIKGVWWYDWKDDGLDPKEQEHNFGIVYNNLTPKPAYFFLQDVSAFLKEYRFEERTSVGNDSVYILRFRNAKNQPAWAAWSITPNNPMPILISSKNPLPVSIKKAGAKEFSLPWIFDKADNLHKLHLTIDETPILITPLKISKN